jgi:16S rRNA (cytosine967-C5)-methyltransferase
VNKPADPRAIAAQALAAIAFDGMSLRAAFDRFSTAQIAPRDRALISALLHDGARWWLRYSGALARLMDKPLPSRDRDVHALLVLGLIQLDVMQFPEYAAVAATVEAVRGLQRPKFSGLVNAVLRRWLRERNAIVESLDADPVTHAAHPQWLLDAFVADWSDTSSSIVTANNREAPLWLRVNRRRTSRADLLARFVERGIKASADSELPDAIILPSSVDVTRLPGFSDGAFSVQDGAAQFAATLLDVQSGQRVLDACAAPGGKSAHILETADMELLAIDRDSKRLPRMRDNLERLGLMNARVELRAADAAHPQQWWDGVAFDRILLDAPCSATGIIRRQPDVKLHRRASDLAPLVAIQTQLLDALWPLLEPGGRLVYATCSVLADENQNQIAAFLTRNADAHATASRPGRWGVAGAGTQNLPGENGMDGFFYAVLEKGR